jgi:hypothetical protein
MNRRKRMRIECLEQRCLFAGDITAAVVNGDLVITADGGDNYLKITATANAGEFTLEAYDPVSGLESTLNGVFRGTQTFSGVTDSIESSWGAGYDTLVIGGGPNSIFIGGALVVDFGPGISNLQMSMDGNGVVSMAREFVVTHPGPEDGIFSVRDLAVGTSLIYTGGPGLESIGLNGMSAGRDVAINLGGGNLSVGIENSFIAGSFLLTASTPPANNYLFIERLNVTRDAAILTGDGSDALFIEQMRVFGNLFIDTGGGNDGCTLTYVIVDQSVNIYLGSGSDQLTATALLAGPVLRVDSGAGFDVLRLDQSSADAFFALVGSDSDQLRVTLCTARAQALFDGGSGFDQLLFGGSLLNGLSTINFEAVGAT